MVGAQRGGKRATGFGSVGADAESCGLALEWLLEAVAGFVRWFVGRFVILRDVWLTSRDPHLTGEENT